jgi:hypothetical protein
MRNPLDPAVDQSVAGKRKGVDLDFGFLADLDKADILIGDDRVDLDVAVRRHDAQQLLGRGHEAAQGMHRQTLDNPGDRCCQCQKISLFLGLGQLVRGFRGVAVGFC